ncbi:MAG: hypothetical protein QM493_06185 [Sulfurovum sp.]
MKNIIFIAIVAILVSGCAQKTEPIIKIEPIVDVKKIEVEKVKIVKQKYYPKPPKKRIKLKKVKDTNFNSDYMYPTSKKKKIEIKKPITTARATIEMSKEECINMITQEKFDKYTKMFGSETASIRRCKMLKVKSKKAS